MPNRNRSESDPNYQEMIAGRSPHRGFVEVAAPSVAPLESPIESAIEPPVEPPLEPLFEPPSHAPAPTHLSRLRAWTSHLFQDHQE